MRRTRTQSVYQNIGRVVAISGFVGAVIGFPYTAYNLFKAGECSKETKEILEIHEDGERLQRASLETSRRVNNSLTGLCVFVVSIGAYKGGRALSGRYPRYK